MRFLMVTTFYPPWNYGGDGLFVQRLTRLLRERGHHVDVVHDADWYDHENPGALGADDLPPPTPRGRTVRLKSRLGVLSSLLVQQLGRPVVHHARLRELLREGDYDVVHFHNVSLVGGPGVLRLAGRAPRPLRVYTTHEHWLVCPMHTLWRYGREVCDAPRCLRCALAYRVPPQPWRYTGTLRRALRFVDHVFAPSEYALQNHRRGGIEAPMSVLPHFFERPEGGEAPTATEPEPDDDARPTFLYVGRLETIKGVDALIAAFARVRGARLLLAGDGAERATLERAAAGLDNVRFLGRVSGERLAALYRDARALLVPSKGPETFGMIVIEAFAHGTPVIARDFGPFPELLRDGGGRLFTTEDELVAQIETWAADAALARREGELGERAWRRHWSADAHLRAYFSVLARLGEHRLPASVLDELSAA